MASARTAPRPSTKAAQAMLNTINLRMAAKYPPIRHVSGTEPSRAVPPRACSTRPWPRSLRVGEYRGVRTGRAVEDAVQPAAAGDHAGGFGAGVAAVLLDRPPPGRIAALVAVHLEQVPQRAGAARAVPGDRVGGRPGRPATDLPTRRGGQPPVVPAVVPGVPGPDPLAQLRR